MLRSGLALQWLLPLVSQLDVTVGVAVGVAVALPLVSHLE